MKSGTPPHLSVIVLVAVDFYTDYAVTVEMIGLGSSRVHELAKWGTPNEGES
jgi:hypothetical protein